MQNTPLSSPLPGRPNTTSADGARPGANVITILNSVWMRASPRAGSGQPHIACGLFSVSLKTSVRSTVGVTSAGFPCACAGLSAPTSAPQSARARSRRTDEPESHGGSSTSLFSRKWFVCARRPRASGLRYAAPRGESSSPRAPDVASATRMCCEDAAPPTRSIAAIASATESDSSASRSRRWMGRSSVEMGRARMALRHTPTEEELNPIFPTIPGCIERISVLSFSLPVLPSRDAYLDDHPDLGLFLPCNRRHREVLAHRFTPIPVLGQDLLRAAARVLGKTPRDRRAPVVPLTQRDLAARVERNDVQDVHSLTLFFGVGTEAIRDALHLLEQVRSESPDGRAERFRDGTDVRPFEFACFLEQIAVDG